MGGENMKKKVLLVIVGFLIIIGVAGAYVIKNYNESKIYTGVATVVQSPSFKKAIVEIRDNQDNVVGKSNIYSNVFWVGEKAKVEYSKKGKNYNITKIESIADAREEKVKIISHIHSDVTLNSYKGKAYADTTAPITVTTISALPEKIAGQYYKTISPSEFFEIVRDIYGGVQQEYPNSDVMIELDKTVGFKVLSFEGVHADGTKDGISYKLNGQILTFKPITEAGRIYYSLRTELENGDIVNYIFWMDETQR
jgi:hypothetical protein